MGTAQNETTPPRTKPLRARMDNVLPKKKRKVEEHSNSTIAQLAKMTNDGSDDEDEDNKPLTQRRAFIQKILARHTAHTTRVSSITGKSKKRRRNRGIDKAMRPIADEPLSPVMSPSLVFDDPEDLSEASVLIEQQSAPEEEERPEKEGVLQKEHSLEQMDTLSEGNSFVQMEDDESFEGEDMFEKDDSLEKRGEVAVAKLGRFMDDVLDNVDDVESNLYFRENGRSVCLQVPAMRKFTTLLLRVAYYSALADVELDKLGQVFRVLENSLIRAMDVDVIQMYETLREKQERDLSAVIKSLEIISNGLEAAVMIFDIVAACTINYKYLPENIILTCLQLVRNHLETTIYPLIDLNGFEEDTASLNNGARTFLIYVESVAPARRFLSRFLPLMTHFLYRASTLLLANEVDDHGVIVLSYISLGVFFHDYTDDNHSCLVTVKSGDVVVNPYEQTKMGAMDVLRIMFNKFPHHRKWILSEILTSLNALTSMDRSEKRYRLRDNSKIHVMSALFMQLVQCCAVAGDMEDHKQWMRKWKLKYQKAQKDRDKAQIKILDEKLAHQTMGYWKSAMEAATQSAKYLLDFVITKCKSRTRDSYSVAEYRSILVTTLEDFLTVLSKPEWPAAELLLESFSVLMIDRLRSSKSDVYLKSLAIEWLGILASRVKTGLNMISGTKSYMTPDWICELHEKLPEEITSSMQAKDVQLLLQCQLQVLESVSRFQGSNSVLQFQISAWGHEYASGWKEIEEQKQESLTTDVLCTLSGAIRHLWCRSLGIEDDEDIETQSQFQFPELTSADIELLSEVLTARGVLYKSYNIFLSEIMGCLAKDVVTYRNRAVKAIRHIVTGNPEIIDEPRIKNAILQRIHDASPSVRDVAVEVIAKYLARQEDVPRNLYEVASSRVLDTAVNVRKRVVKLLRELFDKCSDTAIKVDIASKLIQRISDNEVGISDLAFKSTQEVLFHPFRDVERDGNDHFGSSYVNAPKARKRRIEKLTDIIMSAIARLDAVGGDRNTPLSKIVQRTIRECDDKSKSWFEKVFQWIIDCLFERMLQFDEQSDTKQFTNCLVTIHAFTTTCPDLLRETQISVLQPYLSITKASDWHVARYVLHIYKDVLPRQRYHDPDFIAILERVLFELTGACPHEYIASIVSCLCTVVDCISHRYNILIRILGSCIVKLRADSDQVEKTGSLVRPATGVMKMLAICGLLCQNVDFDAKRQETPSKMAGLDRISEGSIVSLVYELLYRFTNEHGIAEEPKIRIAALQSLGYLFTKYPTLITKESSMTLLHAIFEQEGDAMQTQLMIVFQEFLATEEVRLEQREQDAGQSLYTKEIDVDTLLGNTAEFAELGVNGALMQCFLPNILKCAMSSTSELRHGAFEVITAVIEQGLAHPVLCMPIVVAAETSPDQLLRHRAYYLHRLAHDKYGLLLYSHIPKYLTAAYEYQKLHFGDHVNGYGKRGGDAKVDSLLGMTYSVTKQKKKSKLDFLTALVRPFQFELKRGLSDQIDAQYLRFIADCTVTLELNQSDEVLHLLHHFERIQATSCAELLVCIQSRRDAKCSENQEGDKEQIEDMDDETVATSAIAMYILLKMKKLLQDLYEITDDDVQQYDPTDKKKPHAVVRDPEVDPVVDWQEELLFFRRGKLTHAATAQALNKFESLAQEMTADDTNGV